MVKLICGLSTPGGIDINMEKKTFIDINKNNKSDIPEFKERIFRIVQIGTRVDVLSTAFDIFISVVIITSIVVTFLHTFDYFDKYRSIFSVIELVTTVIFIIEYIMRLYTSDLLYPSLKFPKCTVKFIFSLYGIVDLLTIISYFSIIFSNGFVALRMIRVVRILRLFRVSNNSDAFNVVGDVIYEKRNQICSSLFMIFILMIYASLCMYGLEHDAQPEAFSNAFSGIWWAMSTVLTVGYGDIYPITMGGRIVAILIALLGVGVVAIPTGIISAGFVEYYTKIQNKRKKLTLSSDINEILKNQASEAGMSADEYVEKLILEKEKEIRR